MRRVAIAAVLAIALPACKRSEAPRATAPEAIAADAATAVTADGTVTDGLWFPSTASIQGQVVALSGPALRGRGDGTADEVAAAELVATWLRDAGAEPAGDDGFLTRFAFLTRHSQNVIGIVRGQDPTAGHVVVGAHYDHLGTDGDAIYYGADDNASGVAGLVAITAALARDGQRPRRTVVVVGFGAEEAGLYGSAAYAADPVLPLTDLVAMINLDMIGRAEFLAAKDYALARMVVPANAIGVISSRGDHALDALAHEAGAREGRPIVAASDYGPIENLIRPLIEQRGDHASFAVHGVPYLWLSTSMHDDYHRPTDTADKVDPATIATVGRIVVRVITGLPDRTALQPDADAR